MLTSNGRDLGEENYMKVVDNFDRFPESINTPLSDKWFRSNGFWKLLVAVGISDLNRMAYFVDVGIWA
jgi:hypothetical protein